LFEYEGEAAMDESMVGDLTAAARAVETAVLALGVG
jgi:hypothetical protein